VLFNSYIFIFAFLPLVWALFRALSFARKGRLAMGVLVLGSLTFYAYWNPPYVIVIVLSILFNYFFGRLIDRSVRRRKLLLAFGVGVNLLNIAYFKYTNFLLVNANALLGLNLSMHHIVLPLGISFFTFQQVAYLVDCYRGVVREKSFVSYAVFVSFFPQLIAGPIVHHKEMMPQFLRRETFRFSIENLSLGAAMFSLGLFKKAVIADTLSPFAIGLFDQSGPAFFGDAWLGALAYTFQIYFDFSGYSDMALGLGKMFNIDIPINFNSPYKATSIIDFWRRWHMTLSRFLKDYLYIPLGGNRKGPVRRYVNLMATMLLGGLWHGAAWTFVLWGGLHGLYLCVNHLLRACFKKLPFLAPPRWAAWTATFLSVVVAWVFFRATTLARAIEILKGMAGLNGFGPDKQSLFDITLADPLWTFVFDQRIVVVTISALIALLAVNTWQYATPERLLRSKRSAVLVAAVFCAGVLSLTRVSEFLYFQF
jgi:alginate O-acetyltransferase complex protein AlgI